MNETVVTPCGAVKFEVVRTEQITRLKYHKSTEAACYHIYICIPTTSIGVESMGSKTGSH